MRHVGVNAEAQERPTPYFLLTQTHSYCFVYLLLRTAYLLLSTPLTSTISLLDYLLLSIPLTTTCY